MGLAEVEGEGELLVCAGRVAGRDASDEGVGVAGKVEAGFGAHGLDQFNDSLDCTLGRGVGRGPRRMARDSHLRQSLAVVS